MIILIALLVVDDFTPTALLSVEYSTRNVEVSLGNTIAPEDAQEAPRIRINSDRDDDAVFTIVRSGETEVLLA
jgi:hypothetical protein